MNLLSTASMFALALLAWGPQVADGVVAEDDAFGASVEVAAVGGAAGAAPVSQTPGSVSSGPPIRDSGLDAVCVVVALEGGVDPFAFCGIPVDAEVPADALTGDFVLAAFRRVPLPPSELLVQPPNGRTLVNFPTNFYTETAPFDRSLTLLGQLVELRVTPVGFRWRFGDGEASSTDGPGAAYPELGVTHAFAETGAVSPAVDTTYGAEYRVNGGPWAPVPGTVTIPGAPQVLEVVSATPQLVGYE